MTPDPQILSCLFSREHERVACVERQKRLQAEAMWDEVHRKSERTGDAQERVFAVCVCAVAFLFQ